MNLASHPEWVRGLKPGTPRLSFFAMGSHPEWVRGLKR